MTGPGLRLFTSNRLELLAEQLAARLRAAPPPPLQPEWIVVQSRGMARWLQLQLAERHGICANYRFPFPKALARAAFETVLPDQAAGPAFEPEVLVWRVMQWLPNLLADALYAPLRAYLGDRSDPRKEYQLAEKIAGRFDQYLIFRPELIRRWDEGRESGGPEQQWQAALWREVTRGLPGLHPAALQLRFLQAAENPAAARPAGLPERVSVFGISVLPPFYLQILEALGRWVGVEVYLFQPCREWWGYICSDREAATLLRRAGRPDTDAAALHLERGNRLLAAWGSQGREFLHLIHELSGAESAEAMDDPGEDTLLHCIQSDILHLRDRGRDDTPRRAIAADDDSLQIHSCHSPLRELEILHDHLLHWFAREPDLAPRDVLVMTPDIERYAPLVQAVFGAPERESHRIPVRIADRALRGQQPVVEAFLDLLQLAQSRLGVTTVLALLETAAVRTRFGFAETDLPRLRVLAQRAEIRWGQDAAHRAEWRLPAEEQNTWRQGLDRLLLGYALRTDGRTVFADRLPCADIEGDTAELVGRLADFAETVFQTVADLKQERTVSEWVEFLNRVLERFFDPDAEEETGAQELRAVLAELRRAAELAQFGRRISLPVLLEPLAHRLTEDRLAAGYLTGSVTFCALKPMRSIPFRVICLLGMNDNAYPRTEPRLGFDLMALSPRPGDRSSREDDRYLFLETLLSARRRLYLSYVGQSIRDNAPFPPSVLVRQLLDYVEQGFTRADGGSLVEALVTHHRLQAFSPEYFKGGRLFTYSADNLAAARARQPERAAPPPFLAQPLPAPEPEWYTVGLETLEQFFVAPAKFLGTRRLELRFAEPDEVLAETEPFAVEGLDRYQLHQELLEVLVEQKPLAAARAVLRAGGRLPPGEHGRLVLQGLENEVQQFLVGLRPFLPAQFLPPVAVELSLGEFTLTGQLDRITPNGLLAYRCATLKPKDLLRAWLRHLVWNALDPSRAEDQRFSTLVARLKKQEEETIQVIRFRPVANASALLATLLAWYARGLQEPLRLFERSSHAYAEARWRKGKEIEKALAAARKEWMPDDEEWQGPGEAREAWNELFFAHEDPLATEEFQQIAAAVYQPLFTHREDAR